MQLMIDLGLMENPHKTNETENEGGTVTLSNGHCCVAEISSTSDNQAIQKGKFTQQDRRASFNMLDPTNCNGENSPIVISQQYSEQDKETDNDAGNSNLLLAARSLSSPEPPPPAIKLPPLSSSAQSATAVLHGAVSSGSKGVSKEGPETKHEAVIGSDVFSTDLNTSRIRVVMRWAVNIE